eukprot:XP_008182377.1 PREDICTED: uncharacterized protein LOC100165182 [Acyrthosiphon pisum]
MTVYFFSLILLSFSLCVTAAPQRSNYKFLGCFLEENLLTLGEESRVLIPISPKSCSEFCFEKKYLFFILKNENCYCSKNYISRLMKQFDNECTIKCTGDESASCGGKPNLVSSYTTDSSISNNYIERGSFPIPIYLGCYSETPNDDENRLLKGPAGPYNNNTPQRCLEICFRMGYLYFGNTYGSECWCGNQKPSKSLKVEDINCDSPCSGNTNQFCGGGWKMGIYSTGITDPQGKVSVNNIGCFRNFKRHPILNGWGIISSKLTPKNCVYSCYARRFPYAALVSSKECLCSFTKPSIEGMIEDSMCTTVCSGSSKDTCGGLNAINVYNTGLEWRTSTIGNYYLGCFEESQNNRILNGYSRSFSVNTPEFCSNLCYKFGYIYSGVTYKSECFCGSQSPNEPKFAKLEDKQCNTKCSGDANQFCGGGWRMGVFATGLYDYPIDDRYIGCFVQEENSLSNAKFELINTNVPSKCSAICHNAKYQYAGVMGINCLCSNHAPENNQKVDDANCDTTCVGDSSKTCGGEDRIQIYDLLRQINETESIQISDQINYDDTFEYLNLKSAWSHDVFVAQEPDYEFVVYNSSEKNSFVKNRELVIIPTIQTDSFIRTGQLSLNGCTKHEGSVGCEMVASSYNIIPPVVSARLTTKNNFLFLYGQVEVIAKLPIGDWIVSEIALVSKSNEKNRLVLAKSFGNNDLKCNGDDESATVLKYGLEIDELYHSKSKMMKLTSQDTWHNGYHSFKLSWSPENIVFKIDEETNHLDTMNLPLDFIFDSEYFMSIGVSVGGMNNFRDGCLSNGHLKPWRNFETKAMLNFWKDKNYWSSTWNENKSALRVKKVKFTSSDS